MEDTTTTSSAVGSPVANVVQDHLELLEETSSLVTGTVAMPG